MSWNKRSSSKSLTVAQKRQVRKIVRQQEPKQWEALFDTSPCACLAMPPGEDCFASNTLSIFNSPGVAADWGEAVCHRTRGGLWLVPEFSGNDCQEVAEATDDVRMRLALVKRQKAAVGSEEGFDPWSADWYQGDGVIWRHEHLFFSQWSETFVPQVVTDFSNPKMQGIIAMTAGNATPFAAPPCNEAPPPVYNTFMEWCGAGVMAQQPYCTREQVQARPYYFSSSHIPKGIRVKDGEELTLRVGWAFSCATTIVPSMVVTGGIYGEISESTP